MSNMNWEKNILSLFVKVTRDVMFVKINPYTRLVILHMQRNELEKKLDNIKHIWYAGSLRKKRTFYFLQNGQAHNKVIINSGGQKSISSDGVDQFTIKKCK